MDTLLDPDHSENSVYISWKKATNSLSQYITNGALCMHGYITQYGSTVYIGITMGGPAL